MLRVATQTSIRGVYVRRHFQEHPILITQGQDNFKSNDDSNRNRQTSSGRFAPLLVASDLNLKRRRESS